VASWGRPHASSVARALGERNGAMRPSATKPNRLDVWGDSLLNKLSSRSRKRRKREASKKRRSLLRVPRATLQVGRSES
jgi:hypothetical protein